jgi:hypothetical protein
MIVVSFSSYQKKKIQKCIHVFFLKEKLINF